MEDRQAMVSLLDKLVVAGWVSGTALVDREGSAHVANIIWTARGMACMQSLWGLVSEIEQKAGDLTKEEIPFLKAFAYLATLDAPSNPPPEKPDQGQ